MEILRSIWFAIFFFTAVAAKNVSNQTDCPGMHCCKTRDCFINNIKYNVNLLKNMNITVKPCDNFYEYACGNFDNIPASPKVTSNIAHASNMISKLNNLVKSSNSSNSIKQLNFLGDFRDSCENLNKNNNYTIFGIKEDKLDFLKSVISKLGGWPVVEGDKWNETNFDWIEFVKKANEMGYNEVNIFTSFEVKKGSAPALSLPDGIPLNTLPISLLNQTINAYQNYIVNIAKFFNAKEATAADFLNLLKFELKLMNATEDIALPTDDNSSLMSLEEMDRTWPTINWTRLFRNQLHPYVSEGELIHVGNKNFITKFEKLINETPKRVQADYAIWRIIHFSTSFVNSVTLYNFAATFGALANLDSVSFLDCHRNTMTMLPDLVKASYARMYPINHRVKNHANVIFSSIKNKLIDSLKRSNAHGQGIKRIESVKVVFGYPDELMDDNNLEEYFNGLEITPDNYLANVLNINRFRKNKEYSLLKKPLDSYDWKDIFASTVSDSLIKTAPYSYQFENIIEIPSGYLEGFFISSDRYNYTNYATFGVLVGQKLDFFVDLLPINSSRQSVDTTEQCLTEQYTNLGEHQSQLTQSVLKNRITHQRILDVAYSVYRESIKDKQEPDLAGLYSSDQAFWLSFSNLYCSPRRWANIVDFWRDSAEKTVTKSLLNIKEFSKAFNCPLGSKMNPAKKCHVF